MSSACSSNGGGGGSSGVGGGGGGGGGPSDSNKTPIGVIIIGVVVPVVLLVVILLVVRYRAGGADGKQTTPAEKEAVQSMVVNPASHTARVHRPPKSPHPKAANTWRKVSDGADSWYVKVGKEDEVQWELPAGAVLVE